MQNAEFGERRGHRYLHETVLLAVTALIGIALGAFGVIRNITYKAK